MRNQLFKIPEVDQNFQPSAVTPHDPVKNDALSALPKDYGLKPNGVTIEEMRTAPELYEKQDVLDKAGVAANASGKLAGDVRKAVSMLSKLPNAKITKTTKNI